MSEKILLLASGALLLCGSLISSMNILIAAGSVALGIALALWREQQRARAALARSFDQHGLHSDDSLQSLIDALRYRLQSADSSRPSARLAPGKGTIESELSALGASRAALIERQPDGEITINCPGGDATPLVARLKRQTAPYFHSGADIGFGLRDESAQRGVLSSWLPFGFTHTLMLAITDGSGASSTRGILWLGYEAGPPSPDLIAAAQEFAKLHCPRALARKRIETLTQMARSAQSENIEKSQFIAQMSHDLRSPLSNVRSVLNLLRIEARESERSELIEIALANCESLAEITESVLDLTRHTAGKLVANPEPLDVTKLLGRVTNSFAITARLKGLILEFECSSPRAVAYFDPAQLKRVVSNLLSNAIKYTRSGSVKVTLAQSAAGIEIRVRDTGCGMTAEELKQLFTPFSRFQGTAVEGVGLGLAVSKLLVDLNQGSISARSAPGEGSEFKLFLPEAREQQARLVLASEQPARVSGMSVLLVDDDTDFLDTTARILERQGIRTVRAYSASDALSVLNFELADCIISDASMPEGGVKALLTGMISRGWRIPCIALTGLQDEALGKELRALGCIDIFNKPVEHERLIACLGRLRRSSVERLETSQANAI